MARKKSEADAASRLRECFDRSRLHIRAGDWRGLQGAEIRLVGSAHELHGPDGPCRCCYGRKETHA